MSSQEKDSKPQSQKNKKKLKSTKLKNDEVASEKTNGHSTEPKEISNNSNSDSNYENELTKKLKLEKFLNKMNQNSRGRKKIKKTSSVEEQNINVF